MVQSCYYLPVALSHGPSEQFRLYNTRLRCYWAILVNPTMSIKVEHLWLTGLADEPGNK